MDGYYDIWLVKSATLNTSAVINILIPKNQLIHPMKTIQNNSISNGRLPGKETVQRTHHKVGELQGHPEVQGAENRELGWPEGRSSKKGTWKYESTRLIKYMNHRKSYNSKMDWKSVAWG